MGTLHTPRQVVREENPNPGGESRIYKPSAQMIFGDDKQDLLEEYMCMAEASDLDPNSRVITAQNPGDILKYLDESRRGFREKIILVMTDFDYGMGPDGIDGIDIIRAAQLADTPLISLITGSGIESMLKQVRGREVDMSQIQIFEKPVDPEHLINFFRQAIRHPELSRQPLRSV